MRTICGADKDRKEILEWIRDTESDEIRILVNVNVLSEGIDIPGVSTIVFNDPKGSFIQIV
ncbi:MAG: hypothetical protein EB023_14840 [Flavobacteriia bacterium]|nr:hypothetical protein [Flavobacteriia bacterium]